MKMAIDELDPSKNDVDTGALARVTRAQLAVSAANLKPCHDERRQRVGRCHGERGRTAESNHPFAAHRSRNVPGHSYGRLALAAVPQTAHPLNAGCYC